MSNTTRSTRLRSLLVGSLFTASAVAGLIGLAAPANALSESTIESNCKTAGGTYGTIVRADGVRVSTCCPSDKPGEISGGKCSIYVDGTLAALEQTPTTPKPPKYRLPVGQLPTAVLEPVR
ncbi:MULTISPECIES: hypothetical protein [unclassified Mycobacterium]|uniref:hypothetical protein n=1 Tax=unclassified Mycobacterium TaxID=2642494 RepID=UPI0029C651CC|nr:MULTISPECIES: hypothetical protein [unclassified Mycobacterium]